MRSRSPASAGGVTWHTFPIHVAELGSGPYEEDRDLVRRTRDAVAERPVDLGLEGLQESASRITANIERVIEGKPDAVRLALVVLLSEGHLLI